MNVYDRHDWQYGELITENLLDNIEAFLGYLSENAIMHQGTLENKTDLNNLKANCIYYLYKTNKYSYINTPSFPEATDGIIFVTNKDNITTQIIYAFKSNSFYRRYKSNLEPDWTEWETGGNEDKPQFKEKDLLDFIVINTKMVNGIYASHYGEGNFDFSGNYNGATITENGNTYIYKKIITGIIPIEELGLKNGEQFALYYDAEWTERADITDGEIEDIFETSGNIEIVLDFQDEGGWGSRQIHTMANRMNIITVPQSVQKLSVYVLVSDEGYGPAEVEGQIWNLKLYKNIPNKIENSSMAFCDEDLTIGNVTITNGLANINLNECLGFDDTIRHLANIDKNLIPLENTKGILYNTEDLTILPITIYGVNDDNAGQIFVPDIQSLNNKEFYLLANYQTYNIIKDE